MNQLPQAITAYIDAANAQDPDRVAACFHADGAVMDEEKMRRGRGEIAAWAREAGTRYQSVIEPAGLDAANGRYRLNATVRGNFPGSPIALNFDFLLESGRIRSLEIKP